MKRFLKWALLMATVVVMGCAETYTEGESDCDVDTDCRRGVCTDFESCFSETYKEEYEPDGDYNEEYRRTETETTTRYPENNPANRTVVKQDTWERLCVYNYDVDFYDVSDSLHCSTDVEYCTIADPQCTGPHCTLQCVPLSCSGTC